MTAAFRNFVVALLVAGAVGASSSAHTAGSLNKVKHVIIVMQENHSFDNYFGVLPYVAGTPYHPGPCNPNDHLCVDGLTCSVSTGAITCTNTNPADDGSTVGAFHDPSYCTTPDLAHTWIANHYEANFENPANSIAALNDGFVRINGGPPNETMGHYDDGDLPFYYALAENFGVDDRYFSPLLGPTAPNRLYAMAATSFGHIDGGEALAGYGPAPGPNQPPAFIPFAPVTGSIFSLLDQFKVSWVDYFSDIPESVSLVPESSIGSKVVSIDHFFNDAASGHLPSVAFVESAGGGDPFMPMPASDEHPPSDIRAGQFFVSQVLTAIRNSPNWKSSIVFITYDEAGGFYDHVAPPHAIQANQPTPDGINIGQCEDLSNPPDSQQPGAGANCSASVRDVETICPAFAQDPSGPYPPNCPNFDQYGFRVPLIAVSPFSRPHYVSHSIGDHTSILALIEKRFVAQKARKKKLRGYLTQRDLNANTLEDMFDFKHAPSRKASIPAAPAPVAGEHGCP